MSNLSWTEDYPIPILVCPHCYAGIQGVTYKDFKPDYYGGKVYNCPNCNLSFSLKEAIKAIYYTGPMTAQMKTEGIWTDGNSSSTSGGHETTIPPVGEDPEAGK